MIGQKEIQEFEDKYKRIAHVKGKGEPPPWEIVLRKPTRAEYKQFRSQNHNDAVKADSQEILIRKLAIYPTVEQLDALLDDYPAIPEACGDALRHLAGLAVDEQGK